MAGLLIEMVVPGSIAEEMEIEGGDRLLTINGHRLRDIIDYNYFSADDYVVLEVEKTDGEIWDVEVEKEEGESLGFIFPAPSPYRCGNKCVFCFVHQLPRGLRRPLYVKDEDYRLSFLYGNYVTLANVRPSHLKRIKDQRLSPLYISVHATDPALREMLLGKKDLAPILDVMQDLAAAGITMHTQVVLCPGLNDGAQLEKTVADLAALHPKVASLAVVPVGLTKHRSGLPLLEPVTREYARSFLEAWEARARALSAQLGTPFLFLADEFYLKADRPFPPLEEYGDLPQLENGVGMIPLFLDEARHVLAHAVKLKPFSGTVITGISPYQFLKDYLRSLSDKTGVTLNCMAIENRLFGEAVTVTGLVAGRDIMEALRGKEPGDVILVPDVMLKEGAGVFLDDTTPEELQAELGTRVVVVESTPEGLYQTLVKLSLP